jgi:hypothetical protein
MSCVRYAQVTFKKKPIHHGCRIAVTLKATYIRPRHMRGHPYCLLPITLQFVFILIICAGANFELNLRISLTPLILILSHANSELNIVSRFKFWILNLISYIRISFEYPTRIISGLQFIYFTSFWQIPFLILKLWAEGHAKASRWLRPAIHLFHFVLAEGHAKASRWLRPAIHLFHFVLANCISLRF